MRMVQYAQAQFIPVHIQHAPAIGIVVPTGIGVRKRNVETPVIALPRGIHRVDGWWIGKGGAREEDKGDDLFHGRRLTHVAGDWPITFLLRQER